MLKAAIADADERDIAVLSADLSGAAEDSVEPSADDLTAVSRVNAGLRAVVEAERLNAVTVRCFDLVLADQTSGCYALADVTDAGVIAGCEGDVVSTLGMLWANMLLGEMPWMANPASIDEASNSLWLAHCTVPRSLVKSYRLRSHFESGLGVGIQGMLPTGAVTLLRIGGAMLDQLWLAEGAIVATGDAENLCRTQVQVELARGDVRDLLEAPLGNHIVLIYGHHADRLASWWESML
jgi:L-fucose isomerase-like protein